MYFPYMRGKQNELLALKETVTCLKSNKIFPVIEPVKSSVGPLITTIKELNQYSINPYIIINPEIGELADKSSTVIISTLNTANVQYIPCIRINNTNVTVALTIADQFISNNIDFALYIQEYVSPSLVTYMQASVVNILKESSSFPVQFVNSVPCFVNLCDSFPSKI